MREYRKRQALKRSKVPSTTASDAPWTDLLTPRTQPDVTFPDLESEVLHLKKQIKRMKNYERVKRYRARKKAQETATNASDTNPSKSTQSQSDSSDSIPNISERQCVLKAENNISEISRKNDASWIDLQLQKLRNSETLVSQIHSQEELENKSQIKKVRNAAHVRAFRERKRQLILEAERKLDTDLLEPEVVLTSESHPHHESIWAEPQTHPYTTATTHQEPHHHWTQLPLEPEVSLVEHPHTYLEIPGVMPRNFEKNNLTGIEQIKRSKNAEYVRAYRERQRKLISEAEKKLEEKNKLRPELVNVHLQQEEYWPQPQIDPKCNNFWTEPQPETSINCQSEVWHPPLYDSALSREEEIERKRLIQRRRNTERVRAYRERKRAALLKEACAASQKPEPMSSSIRNRANMERNRSAHKVEHVEHALVKAEIPPMEPSMLVQSEVPRTNTPWSELKTLLKEARSETLRSLEAAENMVECSLSESRVLLQQDAPWVAKAVNSAANRARTSSSAVTRKVPSPAEEVVSAKKARQRMKNAIRVRAYRERQRARKALQNLPKTSLEDQAENNQGKPRTVKIVISSEKDSPNTLKFRFIKDS